MTAKEMNGKQFSEPLGVIAFGNDMVQISMSDLYTIRHGLFLIWEKNQKEDKSEAKEAEELRHRFNVFANE